MSDEYAAFCESKLKTIIPTGIKRVPKLGNYLMPFQANAVEWALKRGRAALFEDTGLGKTRQELEWARVVALHTKRPVLILAPLAVAKQTIREGLSIGIVAKYCRAQDEVGDAPIVVANYEMLSKFDHAAFGGVVLDESSILKNYTGSTKRALLEAFASTPFRLAATATPAPNDHLELGNHAEFLGVLTSHEMIARWFINDTSTFGTYRLKGHATEPFWDWVSSWARCASKPSDLGPYSDAEYELPGLEIKTHVLTVDAVEGRGEGRLFRDHNLSATNIHREKRMTLGARAAKVAELVAAEPNEAWCLWCETDYEADALVEVIPEAVNVKGSMSIEAKESALLGFVDGTHRVIITKPRIAGLGMNFQHCARVAYVAPSFSYEGDYQSLRRFHRFGQKRVVQAHYVMAHTEVDVWGIVKEKAEQHEKMKRQMAEAMKRARERTDDRARLYQPTNTGALPAWLREEEQ